MCGGSLEEVMKRTTKKETMKATKTELAAAFTEWDRRFREEPDRFTSEASRLLKETPETYGEACAPYLIQILNELRPAIA